MAPDSQYVTIQKAVFKTIDEPSFSASLPPLSEAAWLKILESGDVTRAQNDRLEFMGDALMYATLGRQLYKQIPEGTAGLYTATRSVLQANATFCRLSEKFDILAVSKKVLDALTRRTFGEGSSAPEKSRLQMKDTGDLFETVIGAYYLERGFESLSEWVGELFAPLIASARDAYMHTISDKARRRILATRARASLGLLTQKPRLRSGSGKRTRSHMQPPPVPKSPVHSPIKARLLALAHSPFIRAQRKATSPSPNRLVTPRLPLALRITTPKRPQLKAKPIFIDLTGLSDDEEAPSFSIKASGKSSQVQAACAKAGKLPFNGSRSIPREEHKSDGLRLERMLLSNNSDMDLASSDSGSD